MEVGLKGARGTQSRSGWDYRTDHKPSSLFTMSHAMNDEEVNTELKKMVEFIRQEAQEKAREIQVKADEEFAIEKVRRAANPRQRSCNRRARTWMRSSRRRRSRLKLNRRCA